MDSSSSEEVIVVVPGAEVDELKKFVIAYGNELLKPSGSTDEFLKKLDNFENALTHVQDLKVHFEEAIKPFKDALIADEYIRHTEMDVRVSVVSCISQIIRIWAPDDPYEDEQMMGFFHDAVSAFESLSCMSGRAYTKAVSILNTISYSQSCVLMLDIRMHDLIHKMFQTFFNVIRVDHSEDIFSDMENIMVLIIRDDVDCDESAVELATTLLSKLKKENQNVSPAAFRLAENTFKKCSDRLKEYLPEARRCLGRPVEDYAEVVVSLLRGPTPLEDTDSDNDVHDTPCRVEASLPIVGLSEEPEKTQNVDTCENFHGNQQATSQSCDEPDNLDSSEQQKEMLSESVSTRGKRSRKRHSLIKIEEGYDPTWVLGSWEVTNSNSGSWNKKRKRSGRLPKDIIEEKHRSKNISSEDLEGDLIAENHLENRQESSDIKGEGKMVISEDETEGDPIENHLENMQESSNIKGEGKMVISEDETEDDPIENHLENRQESSDIEGKGKIVISEDETEDDPIEASEVRDAANSLGDELVGRRIKVWWPLDHMFYEGEITSFDHLNKRHTVTYDDGEVESLDLAQECWLFIDGAED